MLDERLGNASCSQQGDNQWDVVILIFIVVPEEPYHVCDAEVVVDEACEEGVCLIVAEGVLGCPGSVVFGQPEEVMVAQVYACTDEVVGGTHVVPGCPRAQRALT